MFERNEDERGPVGAIESILCKGLGTRGIGGMQYPYIYNT